MPKMPSLIRPLPLGPLAVAGDAHGAFGAFLDLLLQLGYGEAGRNGYKSVQGQIS
jgi:hypothetical protein